MASASTHHTPSKTSVLSQKNIEKIVVTGSNSTHAQAHYDTSSASIGPLGKRSILDTPFSIVTVPRSVIINQETRNINDLLTYIPSVQLEERGDPNTSRPQSRGFEADIISNSRINGLNIVITTPYAAEQFDNLQVLNGLAGALYGPQNPAGTFDYTLKRPTQQKHERFSLGYDNNGAVLEHTDWSGQVGHNHWFGYRLNLLNQKGESYVSNSHLRRNLISGDFDIHIDPKTVIQIDASQYNFVERGYPGQFTYNASQILPSAPRLTREGYGQPQGGFNTETNTALAKIIHHFNNNWDFTLGGLYQNAYRDVFSINNRLISNDGRYLQSITAAGSAKNFKLGSNIAYLNGKFHTGSILHTINFGTNGYTISNYNPTQNQSYPLGTASIDYPQISLAPQPYMKGSYKSSDTTTQSLLLGDTVSVTHSLDLLGTIAWSWLSTNNYNKQNIKVSTYQKNAAFTPSLSALYKITPNQSVYFTWGRSIEAGPTAPASAKNAYKSLAPLRSTEYEAGYKILLSSKLHMNVAVFRMKRPYSFTNPSTLIFGTYGQQINYGFEYQVAGNISHNLNVLGGVTWLDAQNKHTASLETSNKQVVGVPPVQMNFLFDYQIPFLPQSAFNTNLHFTDRRAANIQNTIFAPSYFTLDLGLRHSFFLQKTPITLRFLIKNITNKTYWASLYPSSINGDTNATNAAVAGLPRTYHFSLDTAF
ncbi:TonB-dependent receptor [Swingsia samuiensis]|uniref:TonB-dependent receptor n=1 Tax=Swingsia samuiensis TaxID=1293412 RepID=UPI001FE99F61|nr:TonB-dependent receptor [Swingsia samuiensis]